jgi:AcrR family transcriptional regulator
MAATVTAPRRTNAERSAATRQRLLDATVECLVERGWAATSTTEVVRRAGVSRGAQVHHFPTKDDLVFAAVEHVLQRRISEFEGAFASLPTRERSAAMAMRMLYERCFNDTFVAWLELAMAARCDPALHERFVDVEQRFFAAALTTFKGLFPEARDDDSFARAALGLAFTVLDGLAVRRLSNDDPAGLDAVLETFNSITAPFFPDRGGDR